MPDHLLNTELFKLPDNAQIHVEIYVDHKSHDDRCLSQFCQINEQDMIDFFPHRIRNLFKQSKTES